MNGKKMINRAGLAGFAAAAALGASFLTAAPALAASGDPVPVPSTYNYNPSLGSLHDYCTKSPDEFPNPIGSNADFRGPCARHDMCYGRGDNKYGCNASLWSDMIKQCDHYYSWYNPTRAACHSTAEVYFIAVTGTHPTG